MPPSDVDRAGLANGAREFVLSGHIESPTTGKSYVLDADAQMGYEILSATVDTAGTGAVDIEFLKVATGIPGLNFTVTTPGTQVKQSATGSQVVVIGQRLTMIADTFGGTPTDLFFSLLCRQTRIVT